MLVRYDVVQDRDHACLAVAANHTCHLAQTGSHEGQPELYYQDVRLQFLYHAARLEPVERVYGVKAANYLKVRGGRLR